MGDYERIEIVACVPENFSTIASAFGVSEDSVKAMYQDDNDHNMVRYFKIPERLLDSSWIDGPKQG